jgi:hypothetical protein
MNRKIFTPKNKTFAFARPFILLKRDASLVVHRDAFGSRLLPTSHDIYRPDILIYERKNEKGLRYCKRRRPDLVITAPETDETPVKKQKGSAPPRLTYRPKILIPAVRLRSRATRPRKKRISWGSSSSPDVAGYRLYWAVNRGVDYGAEYADIGKVNTILLPDEVACFPQVEGRVEIGITALNQYGNESDMMIVAADLDFRAPEPPEDLRLEEA